MKTMTNKTRLTVLVAALICVLIQGCMLGPDYTRPQTPATSAENFVNTPADANELAEITDWWRHFADPVTAEMVQTALKNNYDLKAAAARVEESVAIGAAVHGRRLPDVSYSGNKLRAKSSFNLPTGRVNFISQTYSQDLSISYITDIFGKLKRSDLAAAADITATMDDRIAITHSIVAQVVRSRVRMATQQSLLAIANANIKSRSDTLGIVERRYEQGLSDPLDVHLAKENLASAKALAPRLQQSAILTSHSLDVLLGRRPATSEQFIELKDLPQNPPPPAVIPAWLLDRRPDVHAAEMRLQAATNRVGVSIAAMYPDLTFTASGGYRSDTSSMIFDDDGQVYSAIFALASPIWRGGQLRARVKAVEARAEQAAHNYAQTVLIAMREVEDALIKQKLITERIDALKVAVDEAYKAENLARTRYSRGVEKLILLLETERRRRNVENELAISVGELYEAGIDLFLALGGDWDVELNEIETGL
jgi:multidrug efflux system outer membrane protein